MRDLPNRLDFLSETVALSTHGNTKNVVVTAMEVRGPFDIASGEKAARITAKSFPQLMSTLKEASVWGMHYLTWERRPDEPLQVFFADLPPHRRTDNLLDDIIRVMKPRLDRDWDLFREVAVEFHVIRLGVDHNIMACVCHHVAADAGTASEFGREFLLHYHEIVTGQRPEWAEDKIALSTVKKRAIRPRAKGWIETIKESHHGFMQIFERPARPVGSGTKKDPNQYFAKRVFSEDESARIVSHAMQQGVNFVDALTACTNLAIDAWNRARGREPGLVTTAMTVNTRGRMSDFDTPNNSSVIFFRSTPDQRQDLVEFRRTLAKMRMRHFREHKDMTTLRNIRRLNGATRLFPYSIRKRLIHFFLQNHKFSIAVTFLGTVWPKLINGKPSAESSVTRSADLRVAEVHGVGYKLHSGTELLLIVYAFHNRLNLILEASGSLFTQSETGLFLDLIVEILCADQRLEKQQDASDGTRLLSSTKR